MSTNYKYNYLHLEIRKVESVNTVLNEAIDGNIVVLDDQEDLAELKSLFLDFMVVARTQMNILSSGVSELDKLNNDYILNAGNSGDNVINPFNDDEFKRKQLAFRY